VFVGIHGLIDSYTMTFALMTVITVAGMLPVMLLRFFSQERH